MSGESQLLEAALKEVMSEACKERNSFPDTAG